MAESKNEKFKRLAAKRTNGVLRKLRILGNCANKYSYNYTKEDADKVFNAIDETLKDIKSKFYSKKIPEDEEAFRF